MHTRTAIVTGASSGVGLHGTNSLVAQGWHVVMACRDLAKAECAVATLGIPRRGVTALHLDLGSLASVRTFVTAFRALGMPRDALVNNAAVSLPRLTEPRRSPEGFEISATVDHGARHHGDPMVDSTP